MCHFSFSFITCEMLFSSGVYDNYSVPPTYNVEHSRTKKDNIFESNMPKIAHHSSKVEEAPVMNSHIETPNQLTKLLLLFV